MTKLALDIGYGDVKVKTDDALFKFPSVYAVKTVFNDFDGKQHDVGYYATDKKEEQYIIGQELFSKTEQKYITNYRTLVKLAPFFIFHALQKLKEEGKNTQFDALLVGLTLREWDKRQLFFDAVKEIDICGEKFTTPKKFAFKQGEGIYFNNTTEEETKGIIGVVDIGYNTVDTLVFQNKEIAREYSFVLSLGVERIISDMARYINQTYQMDINESLTRKALEFKKIHVNGKDIDLTEKIRIISEGYIVGIIANIEKHFRGLMVDKVIVGGGGAYFLENTELPRNFVLSEKPYEYQNVNGYFRYYDVIAGGEL